MPSNAAGSVPNPSESVPNTLESAPLPSSLPLTSTIKAQIPLEPVPASVKPDEPPSESTVAAQSDSLPLPSSSVQIPLVEGEAPIPETDDEVAADILDSR